MKQRIEVIGNIASGRSTLVNLLKEAGYNAISENFQAHPFLTSFYEDISEFAFETEMCFLLQHYYDYKINSKDGINVCDYSFYLDDAFSRVTLDKDDYKIFTYLKERLIAKLGEPDLVVYTMCKPETSKKRIAARQRKMEQTISIEYLISLDRAIKEVVESIDNLLIVNTDEIFLIDDSSHMEVISMIENSFNKV